jgi:hypothetical protein
MILLETNIFLLNYRLVFFSYLFFSIIQLAINSLNQSRQFVCLYIPIDYSQLADKQTGKRITPIFIHILCAQISNIITKTPLFQENALKVVYAC